MSFSIATVKFTSEKTCVVGLTSSISKTIQKNDVQVFEIDIGNGDKVYVSWSGETIRGSAGNDGILQINGLYADKLGIRDGEEVVLRILNTVPECRRVSVEPVTIDDWEILERHAAFLETHLLDQVRAVWCGQVLPIWVEKSVCIFLKIGSIEPEAECVLLVNETEVLVTPKVRNSAIGQPAMDEPIRRSVSKEVSSSFIPNSGTKIDSYSDEGIEPYPFLNATAKDQPYPDSPIDQDVYTSSSTDSFDPNYVSTDSIRGFPNSVGQMDKDDRRLREKSPYDPISNIANHWRGIFAYLGFRSTLNSIAVSDDEDDDQADYVSQSETLLQNGLNLVLRVQSLKYNLTEKDHNSAPVPIKKRTSDLGSMYSQQRSGDSGVGGGTGTLSPRKGSRESGSTSPRKGSLARQGSTSPRKETSGTTSPRKGSRESGRSRKSTPNSNFRLNYFPQQCTTIYMDLSDIEKQLKISRTDIPSVFVAKLRKLSSPKEQQQEKSNPVKIKKQDKNEKDKPSITPESPIEDEPQNSAAESVSCAVRVVVVDRRRQMCNEKYLPIVKRILLEQPLLKGHVIIPDMLRRYLKLDVSSRVWIQTYKGSPVISNAFSVYPLGNVPKKLTSDMMTLAFRTWLEQISNDDYPLIVFQGLFVRFPVSQGDFVEAQVTYADTDPHSKGCYSFLHPGVLKFATLSVVSGVRMSELTHPAIQPMLAYTKISSFDPVLPHVDMKSVGGVTELIQNALMNIEICLGTRPLYKKVFLTTPGLLNGMILLTGPKGSGKTTVARALGRQVTELPNVAHTIWIDCKPMRGKKVDTIQSYFELMFDEAAWHEPSLVVLDDMDHIAGAPGGPELELSGEALYAARVAEVLKDLLRKDIRNMSPIAVLATSRSRSSLHPILVSSRGAHLVQEVFNIPTPNKAQRAEILKTILETKTTISESALKSLNLDHIAAKTEGYVARDLLNVVHRAIHAHVLSKGTALNTDKELELNQDNFVTALEGFTPASIRNVPLHQAGELGWDDIGGLTDVKNTLIETLQWPTKYPALFASCPLRPRSGLLLYGAPGTGKTLLAGVVARECGLNFISIKGPELLSKYIGASEQAVRDIFNRAQSAKPCILFFDEFDSLAPKRGHDNTGVTDRVVNQLLTQLDGVEGLDGVYVLAATSRPDLIDPALLRPGRLDKSLHCQLPNETERLKILQALSSKVSLTSDVDLEYFAEHCKDFTGADFKALLYNAQLEAIHEYTNEDSLSGGSRFGMKTRMNHPASRLKSRVKENNKLTLQHSHDGRRRSFTSGTFAYIPRLEDGVKQVSAEMEEKLNSQVTQIRTRERRSSEVVPLEEVASPLTSKTLKVTQKHMLDAVRKMRPSVHGEERLKYQRIYETFVTSRGVHFNTGYMEAQMKATLA